MYSRFSFLNCLHLLSQHIFSVQCTCRACTSTKIMIPQICAPVAALYYGFCAEVPAELSSRGFLLQLQWRSRDSIYRKQSCISDRDENLESPSDRGRMKPALHAYTINGFCEPIQTIPTASNSQSGLADTGKNAVYRLWAHVAAQYPD